MTYSSFSEGLRDAGSSWARLIVCRHWPAASIQGESWHPGRTLRRCALATAYIPGYAFGSGPTKTHVVGANATGGIARNLTAQVGVNYAHGSRDNPNLTEHMTRSMVIGGLGYLIGPVLANLTGNWLYFSNSTDQSVSQSVRVLKKDGHVVIFLCVYEPEPVIL